jgi:hypothetical protein
MGPVTLAPTINRFTDLDLDLKAAGSSSSSLGDDRICFGSNILEIIACTVQCEILRVGSLAFASAAKAESYHEIKLLFFSSHALKSQRRLWHFCSLMLRQFC